MYIWYQSFCITFFDLVSVKVPDSITIPDMDETISYEDSDLDSEDSDATFVYDVSSDNESDNNIF